MTSEEFHGKKGMEISQMIHIFARNNFIEFPYVFLLRALRTSPFYFQDTSNDKYLISRVSCEDFYWLKIVWLSIKLTHALYRDTGPLTQLKSRFRCFKTASRPRS